eukprot:536088-Prymnesium_polylepis.1
MSADEALRTGHRTQRSALPAAPIDLGSGGPALVRARADRAHAVQDAGDKRAAIPAARNTR